MNITIEQTFGRGYLAGAAEQLKLCEEAVDISALEIGLTDRERNDLHYRIRAAAIKEADAIIDAHREWWGSNEEVKP